MKKFQRKDHEVFELPSGDTFTISEFTLTGDSSGPTVYIQASVHGAELQGNKVILNLINFFSKNTFAGKIIFVPIANPMGMNQKLGNSTYGRFNPETGNNWNRNFIDITDDTDKSSEFNLDHFYKTNVNKKWDQIKLKFKKELTSCYSNLLNKPNSICNDRHLFILLQKLAASADIVLDLHTGPAATRYIYAADFLQTKALDLNFPHYLFIPSKFAGAMEEACFMPWVNLQKKFKSHNIDIPNDFEVYTIELGNEETIDSTAAEIDTLRILTYLKKRKLFNKKLPKLQKNKTTYSCKLEKVRSYYSPIGGLIEYLKRPGEAVKKGEVLAQIFNFKSLKKTQDLKKIVKLIKAQKDCIPLYHGTSSAISKGIIAYSVMEVTLE